mmetsp:Transcript_3311/g.3349  ORF Transcript_3311/g.3349 Transcript_3311/m.3349 type:complete len:253 (-) Transcript_3311:32-790(-)
MNSSHFNMYSNSNILSLSKDESKEESTASTPSHPRFPHKQSLKVSVPTTSEDKYFVYFIENAYVGTQPIESEEDLFSLSRQMFIFLDYCHDYAGLINIQIGKHSLIYFDEVKNEKVFAVHDFQGFTKYHNKENSDDEGRDKHSPKSFNREMIEDTKACDLRQVAQVMYKWVFDSEFIDRTFIENCEIKELQKIFLTLLFSNIKESKFNIRDNSWLTAGYSVPILDAVYYYLEGLKDQLTRKGLKYREIITGN